jgi:hypothetical protein
MLKTRNRPDINQQRVNGWEKGRPIGTKGVSKRATDP